MALNPVVAGTILVVSIVAGWIGWRRATRPIYRRSLFEPDPPGTMTRREYERVLRRRRKRWRLAVTVFYALGGAAAGFIFLLMLSLRR